MEKSESEQANDKKQCKCTGFLIIAYIAISFTVVLQLVFFLHDGLVHFGDLELFLLDVIVGLWSLVAVSFSEALRWFMLSPFASTLSSSLVGAPVPFLFVPSSGFVLLSLFRRFITR